MGVIFIGPTLYNIYVLEYIMLSFVYIDTGFQYLIVVLFIWIFNFVNILDFKTAHVSEL